MKICVAQIRPIAGNVEENIRKHLEFIGKAVSQGADLVFFSELSLTGYEPKLAAALALTADDNRLDVFQAVSDKERIVIGVGLPVKLAEGIGIGMVFFQPGLPRLTYCKQMLHADELPYFVEGRSELTFTIKGKTVVPAICYESLQPMHAEKAHKNGADIYLASVAKSAKGIEKAHLHYPAIAKQYAMTVAMANCIGPCDDFVSVGQSAVWDAEGKQKGILGEDAEELMTWDGDRDK